MGFFVWFRRNKRQRDKRAQAAGEPDLKSYLSGGRDITVQGFRFKIRRLNSMDYLEGARVLQQQFAIAQKHDPDKIKGNQDEMAAMSKAIAKAQDFMRDVLLAGVVEPKLALRKDCDAESIAVEDILTDLPLAQELTQKILEQTFGKKN